MSNQKQTLKAKIVEKLEKKEKEKVKEEVKIVSESKPGKLMLIVNTEDVSIETPIDVFSLEPESAVDTLNIIHRDKKTKELVSERLMIKDGDKYNAPVQGRMKRFPVTEKGRIVPIADVQDYQQRKENDKVIEVEVHPFKKEDLDIKEKDFIPRTSVDEWIPEEIYLIKNSDNPAALERFAELLQKKDAAAYVHRLILREGYHISRGIIFPIYVGEKFGLMLMRCTRKLKSFEPFLMDRGTELKVSPIKEETISGSEARYDGEET